MNKNYVDDNKGRFIPTRRKVLGASAALAVAGFTEGVLPSSARAAKPVIGMLPKFISDPYFVACNKGAQQAAKELSVTVDFNGPVSADVAAQSDIVDRWIRRRVSAITVAALDKNALTPALQRAMAKGIKVSTFDSDVAKDARGVFLNQVTFKGFAEAMADLMVKQAGTQGDFLVVTGVLTAPNQNTWIQDIKDYFAQKYPNMRIAAVLPGDEDVEKSKNVALNYLQAYPQTKGIFCVAGPATAGAAKAVMQLNLAGKVVVTGLGTPSLVRPYIKNGVIKAVALWNPVNLGYAAIYVAHAQINGTLHKNPEGLLAGRLGMLKFIAPDVLLLGKPLIIDAANVDNFKF